MDYENILHQNSKIKFINILNLGYFLCVKNNIQHFYQMHSLPNEYTSVVKCMN